MQTEKEPGFCLDEWSVEEISALSVCLSVSVCVVISGLNPICFVSLGKHQR